MLNQLRVEQLTPPAHDTLVRRPQITTVSGRNVPAFPAFLLHSCGCQLLSPQH